MPALPRLPRSRSSARPGQGPNFLLAALPAKAYSELEPHFAHESLASGQVLWEPLRRVTKVYFPDTAVLSIISRPGGDAAIEVGTVGHEGFVGLPVLFGVAANPTQCVAQVPGMVRVLPAAVLRKTFDGGGPLRDLLLRYAHTYIHQVSQRAACSVLHTVTRRCARWLLAADDTAGAAGADSGGNGFMLTQEYLAYMLGVRREGVSAAAQVLRNAGLIRFSRGRITVTDRPGLEAACCACYDIVTREYQRVMSGSAHSANVRLVSSG